MVGYGTQQWDTSEWGHPSPPTTATATPQPAADTAIATEDLLGYGNTEWDTSAWGSGARSVGKVTAAATPLPTEESLFAGTIARATATTFQTTESVGVAGETTTATATTLSIAGSGSQTDTATLTNGTATPLVAPTARDAWVYRRHVQRGVTWAMTHERTLATKRTHERTLVFPTEPTLD